MRNQYHLHRSGEKEAPVDADFVIPRELEAIEQSKKIEVELKFVAMCAKVNISYQNIPILLQDLKELDENGIWKDIKVGRTKARNLIVNVIGESFKQDLAQILKKTMFSICVDESTDISKEKSLAVLVRYVDPIDYRTYTKQWAMIPVFEKGKNAIAGAQRLFECIQDSFASYDIDMDNIYGCCFDGCNTMIGVNAGLKAKLQEAVDGIICIQCPAHKTHLCVQHAVKYLPAEITKLFQLIRQCLRVQIDYTTIMNCNSYWDFLKSKF